METIARLGTFDEVVAEASPEVQEIARELRDVIDGMHPDCVEVPRPGEHASAYGFGEKKMSQSLGNYIAVDDEPADMFGTQRKIGDQ